jgi:hypothetical protein
VPAAIAAIALASAVTGYLVGRRAARRAHTCSCREIETLEAADARRPGGPLDTSHTGRRAGPEVALAAGLWPALDRAVATFPQPDGFRPSVTIDGSRGRG